MNQDGVKYLLELQVILLIHKIKLGLQPEYFKNKLIKVEDIHNYNTRNKNKYYITKKKYC